MRMQFLIVEEILSDYILFHDKTVLHLIIGCTLEYMYMVSTNCVVIMANMELYFYIIHFIVRFLVLHAL